MKRLAFLLHITFLVLFTVTLAGSLSLATGWSIFEISLGLLVSLAIALGIQGALVGYLALTFFLELLPLYPWEAFVILVIVLAVLGTRRRLPGGSEVNALLAAMFGVVVFYCFISPASLINHWMAVLLSSALAGIYAALVVLYLKTSRYATQ